jgi:hypothetical protein
VSGSEQARPVDLPYALPQMGIYLGRGIGGAVRRSSAANRAAIVGRRSVSYRDRNASWSTRCTNGAFAFV